MIFVSILFVLAAVVVPSCAAQKNWTNLFSYPYPSAEAILLGVSCLDASNCYMVGGGDGTGFGVFHFDGQFNGTFTKLKMPVAPSLLLSLHVGGEVGSPTGATGGLEIPVAAYNIQYFWNATDLTPSYVDEFSVTGSLSVSGSASGESLMVMNDGNFPGGVFFSNDSGHHFYQHHIPNDTVAVMGCTTVRYGKYISDDKWFVTLGSWPAYDVDYGDHDYIPATVRQDEQGALYRDLSSRWTMRKLKGSQEDWKLVRREPPPSGITNADALGGALDSGSGSNPSGCGSTYSAQIMTTGDRGETWTSLFSDTSDFYFNEIDCVTRYHCVAVGEGQVNSVVYLMTDGETWQKVYETPGIPGNISFSMLTVHFASSRSVWAGGALTTSDGGSAGMLWGSEDGGHTWAPQPQLDGFDTILDIDFTADGAVGFATAKTWYSDTTVLRYG